MVTDSAGQGLPPALQRCADDLDVLIAARSVVLVGEIPGTAELPELIELLVSRALVKGLDVVVGLEIPMTEDLQEGGVGPFFSRAAEFQDGRSSTAMARLIERLAEHRSLMSSDRSGQALEVIAMDGPWVAPGSPVPLDMLGVLEQPRDEVMAANLLAAMDAHPKAFTLVVAGPMHTRVDRGTERTLGRVVSAWHGATIALRVMPGSGQTWILATDGIGQAEDLPVVEAPTGALWAPSPGADGHHGVVNIGPVTASAPP